MAGAGYKLFQTGDVLTAAQVNTYLNEQTVMVFASAAARTSALTSVLAEGMVSYLQDTNAVEVYDGSAWVSIGASGDITGVTAGTGISGGGTSGTVTITNDMATTITAAGDIVVGTGSGTYDNLPIGTTGQVLTADTTVSPYKVKWASAAGGGKVLQVVSTTYSTQASSSSSTFADTGLSLSITPSSSSSKVLVLVSQGGLRKSGDNSANRISIRLMRGATQLIVADGMCFNGTAQGWVSTAHPITYLDSPSTTSSTTYKTQFASTGGTADVQVQIDGITSTITLLEIGA
jgi:hypothetical protein